MIAAATAALTQSAQVAVRPVTLAGALLTAGSAAATLTIYDNTEGSGTILATLKAAANASFAWTPPAGQVASTGLYGALSGTGAVAYVLTA